MKRTFIALLGVLVLGLFGVATPSKAQATTCSTLTVSGGAYPQNYVWWCDTANATKQSDVTTGLGHLGADAKTRMSSNNHYLYIFKNEAALRAYCTTSGNNTANPPIPACPGTIPSGALGWTWKTGSVYASVAFNDPIDAAFAQFGAHVGNTITHEAAHQLDAIYGPLLYGSGAASDELRDVALRMTGDRFLVGGVAEVGDIMTFTMESFIDVNGLVVSSSESVTVNSGESLADVALKMVNAINNDSTQFNNSFVKIRASVPAGGTLITITSRNTTKFSWTVTNTHSSSHLAVTQTKYDYHNFITSSRVQCASSGSIFGNQSDDTATAICSGTSLSSKYTSLPSQRNDSVLKKAWNFYYAPQIIGTNAPAWCSGATGDRCWSEFFAQATAFKARPITSNNDNPETYLVNDFLCAQKVISLIEANGAVPTAGQLGSCQ